MKYNKGFVPMILIAIIVGALIIGGGVYYLGKNKGEEVVENSNNINSGSVKNKDVNKEGIYSYVNEEFSFAVNLPGTVVTNDKNQKSPSIFTFGVGDQSKIEEQSRIPNRMVVYVYNENDYLKTNKRQELWKYLGEENINGYQYNKFSSGVENLVVYYYVPASNKFIYQIAVLNQSDINNFYLIESPSSVFYKSLNFNLTEESVLKEKTAWENKISIDGKLWSYPNNWVSDLVRIEGKEVNIIYPGPKQNDAPDSYIAFRFPQSLRDSIEYTYCRGGHGLDPFCAIGKNVEVIRILQIMMYFD